MAPKKGSGPQAEAKKSQSKAAKWVRSQLDLLAAQCKSGPAWLESPHGFHQAKLEELRERLDSDTAEVLPTEFMEDVAFYTSQIVESPLITEDEFYNDEDIYARVFAVAAVVCVEEYVRVPSTEEATAAAAELKAWSSITPQGLDKFRRLITPHAESAEVQEACLQRVGTWLVEARGGGQLPTKLTPAVLFPIVSSSMSRFPRDVGVQRSGCFAVREIIMLDGGISIVIESGGVALIIAALKEFMLDIGVCRRVCSIVSEIVKKTGDSSPERAVLAAAGTFDAFAQLLRTPLVAGDKQLEKALRLSMPYLR